MTTATRTAYRPSLYSEDGRLTCPNCEHTRPEWQYSRLQRVGRYADQTVELYRCPESRCRHVFGLAPRVR